MRNSEPVVPIRNIEPAQNAPKESNIGPIIGGVIGGLVGLCLLVFLAIFCWRRFREEPSGNIEKAVNGSNDFVPHAFPYGGCSGRPTQGGPVLDDQSLHGPNSPSSTRYYSLTKETLAATHITSPQTYLASWGSTYTSSSPTASSIRESPLSVPAVTANPISPSEVQGLRVEVENLRRAMQSFQHNNFDPPPEYSGS
jgi:hypothetical protein